MPVVNTVEIITNKKDGLVSCLMNGKEKRCQKGPCDKKKANKPFQTLRTYCHRHHHFPFPSNDCNYKLRRLHGKLNINYNQLPTSHQPFQLVFD